MKILQVNCVYGNGSTGKIVRDIHQELKKEGFESVVCYGRGAKSDDSCVYRTCNDLFGKLNNLFSRITGLMYGGCFFATGRLIRRIKAEKPDVVHLHCINGYFVNIYRLVTWLKQHHIKTVLTLHAEFMHTGNCGYALDCEKWRTGCGNCPRLRQETLSWFWDRTALSHRKMREAFAEFDHDLIVASVSPWLVERAEKSPILEGKKHTVVLNGIDTEVFHPCNPENLRKKYGLHHEKIVFHATAEFSDDPAHIKGGYYMLRLAEKLRNEPVKIIVAGDHSKDIQVPENMILLGRITDQRLLAQYYAMADVTVLTSKKETFSMITAESLCCGTPVVGFEAGAPEKITIPEFSMFSPWSNMEKLEENVRAMLDANPDRKQIAEAAAQKYAKKTMCEKYIDLYRSII